MTKIFLCCFDLQSKGSNPSFIDIDRDDEGNLNLSPFDHHYLCAHCQYIHDPCHYECRECHFTENWTPFTDFCSQCFDHKDEDILTDYCKECLGVELRNSLELRQ